MDIGIFWVYNGVVIGQRCLVAEGEESVAGFVDTHFSHYEAWELHKDFTQPFAELVGTEYQSCPRGRVLYSKRANQFYVYLDKTLTNKESKELIRQYFSLGSQKVRWMTDPHYAVFDYGL